MATYSAKNLDFGQIVKVKVNGQLVDAIYQDWHEEYDLAVVIHNGKRLYRKVYGTDGNFQGKAQGELHVKPSRFNINERFQFISDLVDMVITGESKALIVSGSGGLGKTFTVMDRVKAAKLEDVDDPKAEDPQFQVIKGFTTPKSLYRLLYTNRERLTIFDDCDSVWDNPKSVSLLKAALDSYETRRLSWLSESMNMNEEDDLPASFIYEGKIIFVSNLSLGDLDQAVLSRSLYVDVSMTAAEKIERIKTIAPAISPETSKVMKDESVELLAKFQDEIGDLNIRTFLKVLDIRKKNASNWERLAEYVITAL